MNQMFCFKKRETELTLSSGSVLMWLSILLSTADALISTPTAVWHRPVAHIFPARSTWDASVSPACLLAVRRAHATPNMNSPPCPGLAWLLSQCPAVRGSAAGPQKRLCLPRTPGQGHLPLGGLCFLERSFPRGARSSGVAVPCLQPSALGSRTWVLVSCCVVGLVLSQLSGVVSGWEPCCPDISVYHVNTPRGFPSP